MSASKFKGQVSAQVGDKTFTLTCNMNVMATWEEEHDDNAVEFLGSVERGKARVTKMRSFIQAALQPAHPGATAEDAGDILSEDTTALVRLIMASAPVQETETGNGKAPGKAKAPRRA